VCEEPLEAVGYELEELVGETVELVEDHPETFVGSAKGQKFAMMRFRWEHGFLGGAGEVLAF
jgi:hypothetical protein